MDKKRKKAQSLKNSRAAKLRASFASQVQYAPVNIHVAYTR